MRIDDVIYFAPGQKAIDIDFENTPHLIDLFQSRIENYYFDPTHQLIESIQDNAFAVGVLIVASIDAITYYSIGGANRIKEFFGQLQDFNNLETQERWTKGNTFDQYFRNGLVHEGRIKNGGQFSYAYPCLLHEEHGFMIINPRILLERLKTHFYHYLQTLRQGNSEQFRNKFVRQFRTEIDMLRQHYR